MRGNGLGLSWTVSSAMSPVDSTTWQLEIIFKSSVNGYTCQSCGDAAVLSPGDKIRFKFYHLSQADAAETEMKGPPFTLTLPASKVSVAYQDNNPVHTFYPYFFSTEGKYRLLIEIGLKKVGNLSIFP